MSTTPLPGLKTLRMERHGGFAGLPVDRTHDAAALSAAQRHALEKLLADAPAEVKAPGADRFGYRVTATMADGSSHTLQLGEEQLPAALAPLAEFTL